MMEHLSKLIPNPTEPSEYAKQCMEKIKAMLEKQERKAIGPQPDREPGSDDE